MSLKSFNAQLNGMLGKLQPKNKHVYITGDFNVNMLPHIKSSLDRQDFMNIFSIKFSLSTNYQAYKSY